MGLDVEDPKLAFRGLCMCAGAEATLRLWGAVGSHQRGCLGRASGLYLWWLPFLCLICGGNGMDVRLNH